MRQPLHARRVELRIQTDKPEPPPLVMERFQREPSKILAALIQGTKVAAILAAALLVMFFVLRHW